MNKLITTAAAFAAGLLTMYLFDEQNGRRRRAQWRDRAWSGARSAAHRSQQQARHLFNQARGLAATGRMDRHSQRPPLNDQQLHDRIRAQLGRTVSHPHAIHVRVEGGSVTLTGHVLRREAIALIDAVRGVAGVQWLDNRVEEHAEAGRIPALQGDGQHRPAHPQAPATMAEPTATGQRATEWH